MENDTIDNLQQNQNDFYLKTLMAIFALVFALLAFFVAINLYKTKNLNLNSAAKITISPSLKKQNSKNGEMVLSSNALNSLKSKDELLVNVTMSSDNKSVIGFNTVIMFDNTINKFIGVISNNKNYDVKASVKENLLYITGTKKNNINKKISFNKDLVFKVKFKSIKSGENNFSLNFKTNSTKDSKIIDENNNDILGKVDNLSINIIE